MMNDNKKESNAINNLDDKYKGKPIRFFDKGDHYELILSDDFRWVSGDKDDIESLVLIDVLDDLRQADKNKELHIFVHSPGGYVATLSLLLQQVTAFTHKVGICQSLAASCGFMLLLACNEIYVSPFSSLMYHDVSTLAYGKLFELKNSIEHVGRIRSLLWDCCAVEQYVTDEECTLGLTTEVWLTGEDMIARGAKDYNTYLTRSIPSPVKNFYMVDDRVYKHEGYGIFSEYKLSKNSKQLTYQQIIDKLQCSKNDD